MANSGNSSRPKLFGLAIGPVQEFIATARRTRDLWAGSYILSDVAKAAAAEIIDDGGTLVFPAPDTAGNSLASAPNKILAVIESDGTPERAIERARETLVEISKRSRAGIKGSLTEGPFRDQIQDLLEVYWAVTDLDPDDYPEARRRVEQLLAARKTTRDFKQASWSAPVPKCSLDGQRESVIPEPEYRHGEDYLRANFGIKQGERLCGVCLMKRNLPAPNSLRFPSFPSTSEIAGRVWLAGARRKAGADSAISDAFETYGAALQTRALTPGKVLANITGDRLFVERLEETTGSAMLEPLKTALRALIKSVDINEPSPYYAILQADGDDMGAFLDSLGTLADHQNLSDVLGKFALDAREYVEASDGALVYAGGDDVLAFVPIHRAIECGRSLSEAFRSLLSTEFPAAKTPSLSVGIAIVHHLDALSDALDLVRQAEKVAKSVPGKGGLAIVLSKRGGGNRFVQGKWGVVDRQMEWLIDVMQNDQISARTPYEILRTFRVFNPDQNASSVPVPLRPQFRAEVSRILARKKAEHGATGVDDKVLASLTALIAEADDILMVPNLMIIAGFLADARILAQMDAREVEALASEIPSTLASGGDGSGEAREDPGAHPSVTSGPSNGGLWIIEPRDRFIARDGRPFGLTPGGRATTLSFPFPSSTTGGVRTRAGLDANGIFDDSKIPEVKRQSVRGPFLVSLSTTGEIEGWFASAPADALLLKGARENVVDVRQLVPFHVESGRKVNLDSLLPVGLRTHDPRKPHGRPPLWWNWGFFERWLMDPTDGETRVDAIGHDGPMKDHRIHVGIDQESQTSIDEALFETRALVFTRPDQQRLAMAVATGAQIHPGPALLGGERRLVAWRRSKLGLPGRPAQLTQRIDKDGYCRLVFLTPGFFPSGFPGGASWPHGLEVVAAALPRYQVVSGWNFETRPQSPKKTRRLVPSGSVFFMKCNAGAQWVESQWLQPFGEDDASKHDGFGVVAIGTWSGS